MIEIDGSEGEGGGQVVRNACALSLVTGEPVRITNVRAKRSKPGLMRQHVTAIEAACAIGSATCDGLVVGSSDLTFRPGRVTAGDYRFSVGTAGSTGLVLQTVLMPLLLADAPSRLVLEGGTHNMLAPPFEFIERSFLPIVRRMGGQVEARLVRHGFYPRGGGRIEVDITPCPLRPIECLTRGEAVGVSACALFAGLPMSIAEREIAVVRKAFDWSERECFMRELPVDQGPGNILLLEAQFEHVTEIVRHSAIGPPFGQPIGAQGPEQRRLLPLVAGKPPDGQHPDHHARPSIALLQRAWVETRIGRPVQTAPERTIGQSAATGWRKRPPGAARIDDQIERPDAATALQPQEPVVAGRQFARRHRTAAFDGDPLGGDRVMQQREQGRAMDADPEPRVLAERGIVDVEHHPAAASRLAVKTIDASAASEQRIGQPLCGGCRQGRSAGSSAPIPPGGAHRTGRTA